MNETAHFFRVSAIVFIDLAWFYSERSNNWFSSYNHAQMDVTGIKATSAIVLMLQTININNFKTQSTVLLCLCVPTSSCIKNFYWLFCRTHINSERHSWVKVIDQIFFAPSPIVITDHSMGDPHYRHYH